MIDTANPIVCDSVKENEKKFSKLLLNDVVQNLLAKYPEAVINAFQGNKFPTPM
jgi:hypothetical protein